MPCPKNCPFCYANKKETPVNNDDKLRIDIYREAWQDAEKENAKLRQRVDELDAETNRLCGENEKLKDFYSSFENSYAKMVGKLNSIKHIVES